MRRVTLVVAGLCFFALVALPVQAQDKKNPKKPTNVIEAEKILRPGDFVGKVLTLSGNLFTLRINYQTLELKPGYRPSGNANRGIQNLINQQQRLVNLPTRLATQIGKAHLCTPVT